MSRLDLLNRDCLFEIGVRAHYPDLVNLCQVKPELKDISISPHFQEQWRKHNIRMEFKLIDIFHREDRKVDRRGHRHGLCRDYNPVYNARNSECYYVNDIQHGPCTVWRQRPYTKLSQCMYIHGRQLGIYITWKKTGALKTIIFKSARPSEKLHISFYGEIEIEVLHGIYGDSYDAAAMDQTIHKLETYDADQLNGQSICFYPDGQIKTDAMYKDDQLDGDFKEYDQQYKLIRHTIYVDGRQAYIVFPNCN